MGGNNSSNNKGGGSSGEPRALLELRSSHMDAVSEMDTIKKEIQALKARLEESNRKLEALADKEEDMCEQRNTLLLECYDASLHPCIGHAEAFHHPEVEAYSNMAKKAMDPKTADTCADRSESTAETVTGKDSDADGDAILDAEETAGEEFSRYQREYARILSQRNFLKSKFEEILQVLAKGREETEGSVFHLEMRLVTLEESLLRAQQEVERLALELGGEERKFNAQRSLAELGETKVPATEREGDDDRAPLAENAASTSAGGRAELTLREGGAAPAPTAGGGEAGKLSLREETQGEHSATSTPPAKTNGIKLNIDLKRGS